MPDYSVEIKMPIPRNPSTPASDSEPVSANSEPSHASSTVSSELLSAGSEPVSASDSEPAKPHGPSRAECEEAIKRILITETLESGKNAHFRTSSDFMPYFEALYPAGPGLKKQVQRALKALDMPKDKDGYYMVHKTREQATEDEELSGLLAKTGASIDPANIEDPLQMLVLRLDTTSDTDIAYIAGRLARSVTLSGKFETMLPTTNGILVLTRDPAAFRKFLAELLPEAKS